MLVPPPLPPSLPLPLIGVGHCIRSCFGKGSTNMSLTRYNCSGVEATLAECNRTRRKKKSCGETAGVICMGKVYQKAGYLGVRDIKHLGEIRPGILVRWMSNSWVQRFQK